MKIVIMDNIDFAKAYDNDNEECEAYKEYISKYGKHFNHKLAEFAISKMKVHHSPTGEIAALVPFTKAHLDNMMTNHNIFINTNNYDYLYVANMCKADYYGSSITDEKHLLLYVKDTLDDIDKHEGQVFDRWISDINAKHINIDWESML